MDYSTSDVRVSNPATNLLPPDSSLTAPTQSTSTQNNDGTAGHTVKFDPGALYYDMTGEKILLIFNHNKYEANDFYGPEPPKERVGNDKDTRDLYMLFKRLGFTVQIETNRRYEEIKTAVHNVVTLRDHSTTSCLAIVIMTHGARNDLLCAYDRTYYLSDIRSLVEDADSNLANKPKLFFIQAPDFCKSQADEDDLEILHKNKQHYSNLKKKACRGKLCDVGKKITYHDGLDKKSLHTSTHVDFLISRSSVENYRSWKDEKGSWYIQELCKAIEEHYKTLDILQILTLVTRKVSYLYKSFTYDPELHEKKSTPETSYTLTKLLKLF